MPDIKNFVGARDRNRTDTPFWGPGILSPVRLPVSPPGQLVSNRMLARWLRVTSGRANDAFEDGRRMNPIPARIPASLRAAPMTREERYPLGETDVLQECDFV
jgi:hypothetical protein